MSYPTASAATQPKTGQTLIDFIHGPFAGLSPQVRLGILEDMLPVYEQYPGQNQSLTNQIIAAINLLKGQL